MLYGGNTKLTPKYVLGIDPGLGGAAALYEPISKRVVTVFDMPTLEIDGKRKLDSNTLALMIEEYSKEIGLAIVEQVGAMPGQGVTSMFTFGKVCGVVEGILAANMIPIHYVRPQVWKALLNLSHDKDASRQKAMQMFPTHTALFSRKKDDGRAESLLLAVLGARLI